MNGRVEFGVVRVAPGPDQVKGRGGVTWCAKGDGYKARGFALRGLRKLREKDMRLGIVGSYKVVVRIDGKWVDAC